jgi:aminopeptidase-like protein
LRYSYRFLFTPATIGPISWLALNESRVPKIKHALSAACVGDAGKSIYKKTRRGEAEIDRAVFHVLKHSGKPYEIWDFVPYGYDERQFSSPGFDVPMGSLMRTPDSLSVEHHTSADNLEFVQPEYLADSFSKYLQIMAVLEGNARYLNRNPKCEPQLGKRGIYRALGGPYAKHSELAMFWVLNLSDGEHALLDIAEKSGLPFDLIKGAADTLAAHDLLKEFCDTQAAAVQ